MMRAYGASLRPRTLLPFPPPLPFPSPMELRRQHCTYSLVCVLILASCAIIPYSAFISDQLHLFWHRSALYGNPYPFQIPHAQSPAPPLVVPTDLSHIVFVISGSAQTWHKRRAYTELWWRPNITKGYAWLDKAPTEPWPDTCPPYRISQRDMSRYGNKASASRIAASIVETYQMVSSGPEKEITRWFVMGDDDTVFFVDNLVTVLQKYNHEQMYYVGMRSESVQQVIMHGYGMAFGGGGFAISYPAVAELVGIMDACLDRYTSLYGSDERVHSCLSEIGIPLTPEPGFHQMDIKGDAYGMLAAHPVAPLVSLHHLDHLKPLMPNKPSQLESLQSLFSAYRVDPARILQQAFCYDTGSGAGAGVVLSVSVSWGYTVQVYPRVVAPCELEKPLETFKTWKMSSYGSFIFNTRPLGDACTSPLIFLLDGVQQNQTDSYSSMTQYTRQVQEAKCEKEGFSAAAGIERVRVFAPKMDPVMWKEAPRRHCCWAKRTEGGKLLELGIKSCSPHESHMPPGST